MKKILFTLSLLPLLTLGSCVIEQEMVDKDTAAGKLHLSVDVSGIDSKTVTRAGVPSEEGENQVASLHLLFFEQSANLDGRYVDYVEVEIRDVSELLEMNISKDIDLSGTSLSAASAYNVLAIANAGDNFYLDKSVDKWMSQWKSLTEREVMASARGTLPSAIGAENLLMYGRTEKPAAATRIELLLKRNTVRFDVVNSDRAEYDLVSVSVWNSYPHTSVWGLEETDYSQAVDRVRRHYGVDNEANTLADGTLGDIKGGLYAFENRVPTPAANDEMTTCLIIGVRNRQAGSPVTYHRVNMLTDGKSQSLVRNNAYRLTITDVAGEGDSTEEIAYLGKSNKLVYTMDKWQLDDNGLIVQDDNSVLSVPTKTVTFGREAASVELSIHTFTTLDAVEPLAVRSQTYKPAGAPIEATLRGNILTIDAEELETHETERRGIIVVSYAGLETSINVIQSGVHDDFLRVTLPDGGIPRFPAYAGIASGLISVEASAEWTARIHMAGFSFNPSTAIEPVAEIKSTDLLVIDEPGNDVLKKFRVYTHSFNMGQRAREAIIVISLDKDPETHSSIVRLSQTKANRIVVEPADRGVVLTGTGELAGNVPGNTRKFNVRPGIDEASGKVIPWNVSIEMTGTIDDSDRFDYAQVYDENDPDNNYVILGTKNGCELNTSGREMKAVARVFTDPGTFADIPITQQPLPLKLNPSVITTFVPALGGQTAPITVVTDPSLMWKASIDMVSGASPDGRMLVKHKATLVDEHGDPLEEGVEYPTSTQFRVKFPKIYFPNRDIEVQARVTVSVGTQTQSITVNQNPLTKRAVHVYSNVSGGRGSIDENSWGYNEYGIRPYMIAIDDDSAPKIELNGPMPASAGILHRTNYGMDSGTRWTNTNKFIDENDGVFTFFGDYNPDDNLKGMNRFSDDWKFNNRRSGSASQTAWNYIDTKVSEFINFKVEPAVNDDEYHDYDDISTHTTKVPESATIIIKSEYGNGLVVIDPVKRVVYSGELTICGWRNNTVFQRVWFYIAYTAKYGSAFSDTLIDDEADGGVPAPWDDYWDDTANGGTDNRTMRFTNY